MKVAIITGGSGGIGLALASHLLEGKLKGVEKDWIVLLLDLNPPKSMGKNTFFRRCDVSDYKSLEEAFQYAKTLYNNQIDLVVNNAGNPESALPLHERETSEWQTLISVHLNGVIGGTCLALKYGSPGCLILNTGSLSSLIPLGLAPVYSAAKAGIVGFSRAIAPTAKSKNMRVVAICPVFVKTAMIKGIQSNALVESNLISMDRVVEAFFLPFFNVKLNGDVVAVTKQTGIKIIPRPELSKL